jgi:hypothetical protein
LLTAWRNSMQRGYLAEVVHYACAVGDREREWSARRALTEMSYLSPVEGLRANVELVESLVRWRWLAMRDAREQGSDWDQIGAAFGMTGDTARDFYRRQVERLRITGERHDGARSRAAL